MASGSVLCRLTLSADDPRLSIATAAVAPTDDDGPGVLWDLFNKRLADLGFCELAAFSPTIMLMVRVVPGMTLS